MLPYFFVHASSDKQIPVIAMKSYTASFHSKGFKYFHYVYLFFNPIYTKQISKNLSSFLIPLSRNILHNRSYK